MILELVIPFLQQAGKGEVQISPELVEEFGELCKAAITKQFSKRDTDHTLRMSGVGKPFCQQWMESNKAPRDEAEYNLTMKFLIGDLIEAAALIIMKAAGVNVHDVAKPTELDIGGIKLKGTIDLKIDNALYDVKSASSYAFQNKFMHGNFAKFAEEDVFGYLHQIYLYAEAEKCPVGGFIGIDKTTGEWAILKSPIVDSAFRKRALKEAEENIKSIVEKKDFKRCFELEDETYYGKKTGDKVLNITCSYCPFKDTCWGKDHELEFRASKKSKSKDGKKKWFVKKK